MKKGKQYMELIPNDWERGMDVEKLLMWVCISRLVENMTDSKTVSIQKVSNYVLLHSYSQDSENFVNNLPLEQPNRYSYIQDCESKYFLEHRLHMLFIYTSTTFHIVECNMGSGYLDKR